MLALIKMRMVMILMHAATAFTWVCIRRGNNFKNASKDISSLCFTESATPRNIIHIIRILESSSDQLKGEFNIYRNITCKKTTVTSTLRRKTNNISIILPGNSFALTRPTFPKRYLYLCKVDLSCSIILFSLILSI